MRAAAGTSAFGPAGAKGVYASVCCACGAAVVLVTDSEKGAAR